MNFNPTTAHSMSLAADLAYDSPMEVAYRLNERGYKLSEFFNAGGTQAFIAQSESNVIVSFRGTEPNRIKDWITDIKLRKKNVNGLKVHRGFYAAKQAIGYPMEVLVREICASGVENIFVTGHSMGAALAVCFAFFNLKRLNPHVYLYGCPRVFGWRAAKEFNYELGGNTWRFVNHRDIVTRIPAWLWGYRHVGRMVYFTADGTLIHEPSMTRRIKEWFKSHSRINRLVDSLSDHNVDNYVRLTAGLGSGEKVEAA